MKTTFINPRKFLLATLIIFSISLDRGLAQVQVVDSTSWFAYVPPAGIENADQLPPYDQWPLLLDMDKSITLNATPNRLYLLLLGNLADGSHITPFQVDHMIYRSRESEQVIKKIWK